MHACRLTLGLLALNACWLACLHACTCTLSMCNRKRTSLTPTVSIAVQTHASSHLRLPAPTVTLCLCRFYQDCDFSRALTSEDMLVLCQLAGFKHHPMLCDTELLSAQQWFNFGQRFVRYDIYYYYYYCNLAGLHCISFGQLFLGGVIGEMFIPL